MYFVEQVILIPRGAYMVKEDSGGGLPEAVEWSLRLT